MFKAYISSLATLLLLTSSGAVLGQRTGFGIKAGPQISTYRASNIRTTMLPGFTAGVYIPISAATRLELQPEVLLSTMGTGFIEPDGDRYFIRSLYVQAPIVAKYYFTRELNLQGGVQMGKLLIAQRSDAIGTTNVRDRFKTFDIGFDLGAGLDMRSGLDLTIRYYSGMPTLLKDDDALFPRSRSLQFTLGKRLIQLKRVKTIRRRK
ncbi:MAG: PorT family protein [Bacteroidota bacterium]|nr:PorT family protein [Bacteroidota bacterium]